MCFFVLFLGGVVVVVRVFLSVCVGVGVRVVSGAGCAVNLFSVAHMQLTGAEVGVYSLHHSQYVCPSRMPFIPLCMRPLMGEMMWQHWWIKFVRIVKSFADRKIGPGPMDDAVL